MQMRSLWADTAAPGPTTGPLDASIRTDVAVVGGGYTGLSASLRLAEDGAGVAVLEAGALGGRASSLNGGQVIPGLKQDPDELLALFGPERGERLVEFVGGTAATVFGLIDRYGIACDDRRVGWIQAAHTAAALDPLRRRVEAWQRRGAPIEMLDAGATASLLGTDRYVGAAIDRRAGALQPLSYARGLARAAHAAGARLFTDSRAVSLQRVGGRWRVTTSRGSSVDAERVLLCTNGYTDDLWPNLRRTVIAANSFQVATPPLPYDLRRTILAQGHAVSDTRKLLRYFRCDAAGRFLMGGRGRFRDPRGPEDLAHLHRAMIDVYPALTSVDLERGWGGRVALTRDFLPHLHQPAPGLTAFLGYNGRGVAMATACGLALGGYVLRGDASPFPFPSTPIRPIPFHGLRRFYVASAMAYYRFRDAI
jgi:glycine/D-amino acid oxidase-like deaminating enzyme